MTVEPLDFQFHTSSQRAVNVPDPAVLAERLIELADALQAFVDTFTVEDALTEEGE